MTRRVIVIGVVLSLGGVALALFLFTLGITGSVSVGNGSVRYVTSAVPTTTGGCQATYQGTDLNLTWTNAMPGETCSVVVIVGSDGNTVPMRLQEVQVPTGLTGMLGADCGKTIQPNDPNTYGVGIDLTLDATTGVVSFALGDGLVWVAATDYLVSSCS